MELIQHKTDQLRTIGACERSVSGRSICHSLTAQAYF